MRQVSLGMGDDNEIPHRDYAGKQPFSWKAGFLTEGIMQYFRPSQILVIPMEEDND